MDANVVKARKHESGRPSSMGSRHHGDNVRLDSLAILRRHDSMRRPRWMSYIYIASGQVHQANNFADFPSDRLIGIRVDHQHTGACEVHGRADISSGSHNTGSGQRMNTVDAASMMSANGKEPQATSEKIPAVLPDALDHEEIHTHRRCN